MLQKRTGLTLIELVVTIGVMALIIGLTTGILIAIVRSNQKARLLSEINRTADNFTATLEENIRSAHGIEVVDVDNPVVLQFTDKNEQIKQMGFIEGDGSSCSGAGHPMGFIEGDGSSCSGAAHPNGFIYFIDFDEPVEDYHKLTNDDKIDGVNVESLVFTVSEPGTSRVATVTADITISNSACNKLAEYTQTFSEFVISRVQQ